MNMYTSNGNILSDSYKPFLWTFRIGKIIGGLKYIQSWNKKSRKFGKGDVVNPIVNTVLPHNIFKDWVWQQQGMDGKAFPLFGLVSPSYR